MDKTLFVRTKRGCVYVVCPDWIQKYVPCSKLQVENGAKLYTVDIYKSQIIAQSDNILDLIDEIVKKSYEKTYLTTKEFWDDPDFDPEQEEMYGSIWVTGDNGAPTLKPVIKKTEIGKWEFI